MPLIIVLAAVVVCLCWFLRGGDFSGTQIRNVLLISIDTCRADHLSCYGFLKNTTPNIDAIAADGILFENVISPVPITLPSHSSMLTGTIPPYHGVHDNYDYRLGESNLTLAEILKDKGFSTGGIVSAFVMGAQFGVDQGFDSFNDRFENLQKTDKPERIGTRTSGFAIEWLEEHKDEKFFLFLHYFDPHYDYKPPEPFASEFAPDLYAGEIAYTDYCIGQVIDKLKELGLYDSTLIIITSDHGEMLGEHGESTHSFYIYQGAVRVPLIFKLPGRDKSKVITKPVGLIDIVPTICGLLGIDKPDSAQGTDISGYCTGKESSVRDDRYLYCESFIPSKFGANPLLGVINNRYKYIQAKNPELYDLLKDPKETDNLAQKDSQRARILKDKLQQILEKFVRKNTDGNILLDTESLRRLESLGYVGGSVEENFEFDPAKEDHKEVFDLFKLESSILVLSFYGKFDQAKRQCEKLLIQRPNLLRGHQCMVDIAIAQEDISLAETHNLKILEIKPDYARAHNQQGLLYQLQGRHDEAINHFHRALKLGFHLAQTYDALGISLASLGKFEEAVQQFRLGLEIEPDNVEILNNLGMAYQSLDKLDEAIESYLEVLRLDASFSKAHYNLGRVFKLKGAPDKAMAYFQEAVRLEPSYAEAHNDLGMLLAPRGQYDQAEHHFKEVLRIMPSWTDNHDKLGHIYYLQGKHPLAVTHWKEAVKLQPDSAETLSNLAWLLAASADAKLREPDQAVTFAEKACKLTNYADPQKLDTLAVAYAAEEDFSKAIETAVKAIELAASAGSEDLVDRIKKRLALYKTNQPYIELLMKQNNTNP